MDSHSLIKKIEQTHLKKNVADVRVGDSVRVHYKIREGNKERVQVFEGLVIATKAGSALQGSFTVRKVVTGVGVERTFPLHSPWVVKVERTKTGKVRRAKLNFVRRYALSSRFKLKDKGKAGTVWEEIAEQVEQQQQADQEVATEEVVAENAADELEQDAGEQGGADSDATPAPEETENSEEKSSN